MSDGTCTKWAFSLNTKPEKTRIRATTGAEGTKNGYLTAAKRSGSTTSTFIKKSGYTYDGDIVASPADPKLSAAECVAACNKDASCAVAMITKANSTDTTGTCSTHVYNGKYTKSSLFTTYTKPWYTDTQLDGTAKAYASGGDNNQWWKVNKVGEWHVTIQNLGNKKYLAVRTDASTNTNAPSNRKFKEQMIYLTSDKSLKAAQWRITTGKPDKCDS